MLKVMLVAVMASCVLEGTLQAQSPTNQMQQSSATDNPALSDKGQIRVAVLEHLINYLSKSTPKPIWFAALSDEEKRVVRSHLKDCDIREPARAKPVQVPGDSFIDKVTGESGIVLEIKSVKVEGKRARVRAGYFSTAGVTFDFEMAKEGRWMIKRRSSPTIAE